MGNHNVETLHDRPKGSKDLTVVVPLSGYFVLTQKTIADFLIASRLPRGKLRALAERLILQRRKGSKCGGAHIERRQITFFSIPLKSHKQELFW